MINGKESGKLVNLDHGALEKITGACAGPQFLISLPRK